MVIHNVGIKVDKGKTEAFFMMHQEQIFLSSGQNHKHMHREVQEAAVDF